MAELSPWILGILAGNAIGLLLGYWYGWLAADSYWRWRLRRYRGARRVCHG